jgi:FtsZ-binding cell division protein ZapB
MLAATFNQALVGLVVAIPSGVAGYFGYRKAMRGDRIAEQAGIATSHERSIGQVVDGLNGIIANLQGDNTILRNEYARLRESVDAIRGRIEAVEMESFDLRAKNRELTREMAVLHAENEALRIENLALRARVEGLEKNGPLTSAR